MQTFLRLTGLALLLSLSTVNAREPVSIKTGSPENAVQVTIIYDNYQSESTLQTDWGFGCLVEYKEDKLLFDAGRIADLYQKNSQQLDIDPAGIPSLFISHEHGDHTAGIQWITEKNPSVKCYLPASFAKKLKASGKLPRNSTGLSEPTHLYGPFYSTGDDFVVFKEQGLVIKTEDGGVLITGCGHPGIIEMVAQVKNDLGIEVHTVIGGLHLMQASREKVNTIANTLKELGIKQICPTHCTGDQAIAVLKGAFGDGYIPGGTGQRIVIE